MYKSVAVHDRPRGMMTRVKRVPLGSFNRASVDSHAEQQGLHPDKSTCLLGMIPAESEMTLDELS